MIGRVELGSTFPTITISPTTTDFNGNACLGWSAAIGDIPLFLLKHVSVTAQLELRKKFAVFSNQTQVQNMAGSSSEIERVEETESVDNETHELHPELSMCEIDRARVVEETFPGPKTCVFSLRYFFSAVASCSSQGGQLDNSTTVFCLTQPFCSRARQRFRFAKAYGIPGLRSPTIIWKHLCVVSATHRSQTVADRHRP